MAAIKLFISYSHKDELFKEELDKHLFLLKKKCIVETWNDRRIVAGEEWDKIIKDELENANIILLLISVDFLNSDYCYDIEVKRAMERHENKEAVVIPIILRKCDWHDTIFGKLQALPRDGKPIKTFSDQDEAFLNIIDGIKSTIEYLNTLKINASSNISSTENISINIIHKMKLECDTPPNTLHWIGRQNELIDLELDLHKIVFISGIGGQGKSALAAYYIKHIALKNSKWQFWDWRDCQEKENRIHTKIISIISRLTNGDISAKLISEEPIEDLIELLFKVLSDKRVIFVFDNIDAYIEFETFHLTGTVGLLYKAALNKSHNSKFIFTCRSTINDIDPQLLSIKLSGLTLQETNALFNNYKLPFKKIEIDALSKKSYELTKGHPLWLNLIAAQAKRGLNVAEKFIKGISSKSDFAEESYSSILSNKILNAIWTDLNEKQKTLLMAFASIVRAETEANLSTILESELNYNQFNKAFKALKQLNLIVIKSAIDEQDTFELHPLVKEYILQNFSRGERSKFISLFVNFYDGIILILKPKLSSKQPLSFFENWTAKIELAVNKDDYKSALVSMEEISDSICDAGYVEEYIRVATLLFINIDWKTALNEEWSYFNSQLEKFIDSLTEFGKFDQSEAFITKYRKNIVGKGSNYLRYCRAKSHFYWFQSKYEDAIKIAKEGISLESKSDSKTELNLKHSLALALRDTKIPDNIEESLKLFLNGKSIDDLFNENDENFIPGEVFGNVGRCLQYKGDIKNALKCYSYSLNKLEDLMNKGYGNFWSGECMASINKIDLCLFFYKNAFNIWNKLSPIKAINIDKKIKSILIIHPELNYINETNEIEIDEFCLKTLESFC